MVVRTLLGFVLLVATFGFAFGACGEDYNAIGHIMRCVEPRAKVLAYTSCRSLFSGSSDVEGKALPGVS
jgi:hypothetical protein